MTHRGFQTTVGTPLHMWWNGEDVLVNGATSVRAVVDLDHPVNEYDRGKKVVGRGKVLLLEGQAIALNGFITIRGDRWEIDRNRKPEDGNRIWWVLRNERQSTSFQGGMPPGDRHNPQ
jgi:hypothetical protein